MACAWLCCGIGVRSPASPLGEAYLSSPLLRCQVGVVWGEVCVCDLGSGLREKKQNPQTASELQASVTLDSGTDGRQES